MVDRAIKRIRPADFELSQVQDNLGNVVDQLCAQANQSRARTLDMGTYWSWTVGMPTSDASMIRAIISPDNKTSNQMRAYHIMPRKGYVTSIQGGANYPAGGTYTFTLYINGKPTQLSCQTSTLVAFANAPNNKFAFNAGDELSVWIRGSSSTMNQSFSASIDVESQA